MKVLVLGGDGMLGHKVFQVLQERFELYVTFRSARGLWMRYPTYATVDSQRKLSAVDVLNFDSVVHAFGLVRPAVVINCIGIVKQLKEAKDPIMSLAVNSLFPHRLAQLCAATQARLLHMSTDCVFSGRKGRYTEQDVPDAEDLYGRTKLLGEIDQPGCLTIRTSIFGRDFLRQTGLLEWFLSQRGGRVKGYKNAVYTGFTTWSLARIIGDIIADYQSLSGLYHIASEPISKYELLVKIRDACKLNIEIEPYDDPPCDRSLSAVSFVTATSYRIPAWDEMIAELAKDLPTYDEWRKRYGTF